MRYIFQFLTRAMLVVTLLGIPILLIYLQIIGFSESWRAEVAKALSRPGFKIQIGKVTFHPLEGIVAEGVAVCGIPARQLAKIDRLLVSLNIAQLACGKISIDRLDLENASVSIPFARDGVEPDTIELRRIRAGILNSNDQLTITHAECWLDNIHFTVRGHLLNPELTNTKPSQPDPAVTAKRALMLRSILRVIKRFQFSEPKPEIFLHLYGDLLHPESISADEIKLQTGRVQFEDLRFDQIKLLANYQDRTLQVASLHALGPEGTIQLTGKWSFTDNFGQFHISSNLTWAPLLRLAGRTDLAKEISFDQPPEFETSICVSLGTKPIFSLIGQISTQAFRLKNLKARSFKTSFAWKDNQLYVQDAVLQSATGMVRANVLTGPGIFKLNLESEAIPNEFIEFFGPKERKIIDLLEFRDTPKLKVTLTGTRPSLDTLTGTGTIELGRAAMRNSWIDFARSNLVIKDRAILYKNLTIGKGELRATGSFTYDFGRQEVRLQGVHSNIYPPDVLMWVDPRVAASVAEYRFRAPPDIHADGVAHMKDPMQNNLRIEVNAEGGVTYSLLNKDLVFGATKATVLLKGQRVFADIHKSSLYGGSVTINTNVSIDSADPTFSADIFTDRIDFPSLTKLYFGYAKSEGVMSGNYSFHADLKKPELMQGKGYIRVEEGHVLAIPLFGPLSVILSTIIPGAGHESARLATMDFTVADQLIRTKNLDIQGAGFELFGEGNVGFPNGKLDLTVRINAKGIPGVMLFPMSKLFEYISTGTVSNPQWRPKIIPQEFFDVLGMGIENISKEPSKKATESATPIH